ncbi:MAG: hypothetical protein U9R47_06050 [Actinomycetota bacterium]|nr:hypothetical protein [Actinomycetota bacterium]
MRTLRTSREKRPILLEPINWDRIDGVDSLEFQGDRLGIETENTARSARADGGFTR